MADLAKLGFLVDPSPLARARDAMVSMVPAAREAQSATDGLSESSKRAKPAVDGLADAAKRAKPALDDVSASASKTDAANQRASQSYSAHEAAVRRITGSYQQYFEVRDRVDRITGVSQGDSGLAEMIQQGRALDDLRARFNPLFAAQRQYKQELIDIRGALRQGAISQKEYADAITNTKVAFASQVNAIRGVTAKDDFFAQTTTGAKAASKAVQGLSFDARNLSFQLVDVGQGLLTGQSPFMIFAQQAGQIGQIAATSEKGIKGLFAEIWSGIARVLTPMRLLTLGIAGVGLGLVALMKNAVDSSKALDDLGRSIDVSLSRLHGLEQVAGGRGIGTDDFAAGMKSFGDQVYRAQRGMGDLAGLMRVNGMHAKDFQGYMQNVADLVGRTKSDQQAQKLLVEAGLPANEQWVRYMRDLSKGIDAATASTVKFDNEAERNMVEKARQFDKAWDSAITKLVNSFKSAAVSIAEALTSIPVPGWLKTLMSIGTTVTTSLATMGLGPLGTVVGAGVTAAMNHGNANSTFSDRFAAVNDNNAHDNRALQDALDRRAKTLRNPDAKTLEEMMRENQVAQQRIALLGQMASVDDQVRAKELELAAAFLQTGVGIGSRRDELLQLVREQALGVTQIKAQADAYKVQTETVGMSIGQTAAWTAEQNRLNEALRNHQILTDTDKAAIHAAAEAMGKRAQAAAEASANEQALFDLQTSGLSGVEQQIAQIQQRLHGKDWQQFMNDGLSATMRLTDQMRQMQDATKGFTSDFLSGLREGKNAFDSLLGAASNFATKLANMGLDKMMSGLTGGGDFSKLFAGIGRSASQGITEGFDAIQAKAAAAKANPANSFNFNGSNGLGQGIAGAAAAVGIFGQGQQIGMSGGSATTGALSGALSGALAGSVIMPGIGTAIGAVVGGIAGLLGASDGAKKAAQQAKDDWANAKTAADLFGKQLAGSGQGSLTTALAQAKSQTEQYTIMAQKAKDFDAADRLGDQYNQYYKRMTESFRDGFNGIVDAFSSGLGPNSPFATGAKNVKDIGEELKGFIEDTKTAMDYLYPDSNAGAEAVAKATAAAQKYMLSLLGQAPVLTDTQTAIQHLSGTAAQLQTTLVDLGMSSKDAADAINAGVLASMKQLADTFANGIQREINAASGQDYLNSISDLVAKFQSNLADAAALGLGPDLVNKWFKVSAQKIVDDAGLAGDAIAGLVKQFPDLAGVITASVSSIQSAYDDTTSLVNDRRQDLVTAYQTEAKAYQDNTEKLRSYIAQLKQFQQSLNIGQYSPYSPEQQYLNAKSHAQQDFALAMDGDQDAMDRIQNDLSTYLDQSRSYNASSEQYFRDFQDAQDMLDKLQASGQKQLSTSQQQLDALNAQVSGLIDIKDMVGVTNTSVLSVTAAIAALQSALAGQKQASDALVTASPQSNIDALYQSVLGRSADAAGKAYWQQQIAAGLSGTDLTRSFISGAYAKGGADAAAAAAYAKLHGYQHGGIIGAYADGGVIGSGIFGRDSSLATFVGGGSVAVAGGEYVMPAEQTRKNLPALNAMRAGNVASNDNTDVVAELRAVAKQVERLSAIVDLTSTKTQAAINAGTAVNKKYASDLGKVVSRI